MAKAVARVRKVVIDGADSTFDRSISAGQFVAPDLKGLRLAMEMFYRSMMEAAVSSAEYELGRTVKLAKGPKAEIPKGTKKVSDIYKNRKFWQSLLRRSNKLADSFQKDYLDKLQRKWKKIIPHVIEGSVSPEEAKLQLRDAWGASKSRVETIFRTETTTYYAKSQIAFYAGEEGIIGYMFDGIGDTSQTKICSSRHGAIFKPGSKLLKQNTPALHFNCRSDLIPLANTPQNRKMLADPNRDAEALAPKFEKLPKGWKTGR